MGFLSLAHPDTTSTHEINIERIEFLNDMATPISFFIRHSDFDSAP
jgi:hypothetical protein